MEKASNNSVSYFLALQLLYWAGVAVIVLLSLMFYSEQNRQAPIVYFAISQGLLGCFFSFPLRLIFGLIWNLSLLVRMTVSILSVTIAAGFWTVLVALIQSYLLNLDEPAASFSAWYMAAFYVLLCWSAFFHGIEYFILLESEHQRTIDAQSAATNEQLMRLQAETHAQDAQLKMLRYQLNPHFLFNTLNAIGSLIQMQANSRAKEMVVKLSHFLRWALQGDPDLKVSVEKEIEILRMYLDIEQTRFQDRLSVNIDVSSDAQKGMIPSLLLQPLIENSMKYAIAKSENGGSIDINAQVHSSTLQIVLKDSGAQGENISDESLLSGTGIGLQNIKDRLKSFYGDLYEFEQSVNDAGGVTTTITIPYQIEG